MTDEANLDAYLRRINYAGSIAPTLETLQDLVRLHVNTIPFENLDPLMGLPVRLQLSDIEQKLLLERRGGYCLEHNLLLKAVLESMDYAVTTVSAGVLWGHEVGYEPIQSSHVALLVDLSGVTYLADVGFGGPVMTGPLRLRADAEQELPLGRYRLTGGYPRWKLEGEVAGEWRPYYQFTTAAMSETELVAMNDYAMQRHRDNLWVARVDGGRRHALRNARYNIHGNGETTTRMLTNLLEIRDVLTNVFGIGLPATDRLDPALEKGASAGRRLMAPFVVNEDAVREFKTPAALQKWYKANHAKADELWIKMHKKGSGLASVTALEGIDAALCWGWIDGIRKGFNEQSFLQRYTPRGRRSIWSQVNIANIERLRREGLMQPSGEAQVTLAQEDGRWAKAYGGFTRDQFPADLLAAIEAEPEALDMFSKLNAQNKYALGFRTHNMKTEAGRARKIGEFVEMLKRGETIYPNGKTK